MRETTTLPNCTESEQAARFALITPSASPPAHCAALNVRTEATPRPSYKRPRVESIGSASTPTSSASASRTLIDPTRDEAWRASSQRLLSVWDTLAERYSVPEEEDDIVDIISGKIITDRGVTRSLKKHGLKFGHLLLGFPEPEPPDGYEETSEDGDQTEIEDEVDEIDAFASEPEVPIKVEIEKEARILPPFSEMDPADAQDLKEFLEEERRLRERVASGVQEEGESDAEERDAADSSSSAKSVSKSEDKRVTRDASPPRVPASETRPPATLLENESEDELAKWEIDDSSAPVVSHTPKRYKTPKRLATPKARATPRPIGRDKSPPSTVIDLTQDSPPPDIQVFPRMANVEEHLLPIARSRKLSDTQFKTPSNSNRSPMTRRIQETTRNLQLQTPPISARSSSSMSLDVIQPKAAQDPYQAAADLFFEPTPPPLVRAKPPVTPKARRTLLPSKNAEKSEKSGGFGGRKGDGVANSIRQNSDEGIRKQQRTSDPRSSRAKSKPRHVVEVVVPLRAVHASGISTRGGQSVMNSSDSPDLIDGVPGDLDPSPRPKSSKAKGKERERYTPKYWADLSDDDDLPPPPRRSVSRTPMPSGKALQETRKRKRPSSSRSLSPVSPKDKISVSPRPSRARESKQVSSSRARSICQSSDEEDEPLPQSTSRHAQRSQSGHVPRPSLPFSSSYPAPPSRDPFSHSSLHSPSYPPPHDPLRDPQARYHLAQAVQYLSYFLPRFPPPSSARFPLYANGYPPLLPRHEPEWLSQPSRVSRSRRDANFSYPIPESSFDTTPRRRSHPYPYAIDPMYSSPTEPPASSSPAPSSPAAEARSSPIRNPRSPSTSRTRSKSRMRRVSFRLDSDLEDPPSVRGRQTRDAADDDKNKTPGKRRSDRRASSVGLPATPPKPSRRQASQGPAGRRFSSGDESDALRPGSPVRRTARGRTPGPSLHRAKSAVAPGRRG